MISVQWNAGITRIPAGVDAIALSKREQYLWCCGTVKQVEANGSVVTNFAILLSDGGPTPTISGFLAKASSSINVTTRVKLLLSITSALNTQLSPSSYLCITSKIKLCLYNSEGFAYAHAHDLFAGCQISFPFQVQ